MLLTYGLVQPVEETYQGVACTPADLASKQIQPALKTPVEGMKARTAQKSSAAAETALTQGLHVYC